MWVVVHVDLPCAHGGVHQTQYNEDSLSRTGVANTAACQAICAASSACDFFSYSSADRLKCATYYQGTCKVGEVAHVGLGYTTYAKPPLPPSIRASSRYSTHTTTGPEDALSVWQTLEASSPTSTHRDLVDMESASFDLVAGSDVAVQIFIEWHISASNVGEYYFQAVTDFGRFGVFEVDSVWATKSDNDFGERNTENHRFERFGELAINLTAGAHYLQVIGFENCCGARNLV